MPGDRYAKLHSRFWIDPDIRALGRDARELYIYLISSPHSNMAGYYYLPLSYVVEDMDTEGFSNPFERVREGFRKLIEARKIGYDPATKIVLVRNVLAWDVNPNPNQVKGIITIVESIPQSVLLPDFVACAQRHLPQFAKQFETLSKGFLKGSETVSNPVSVHSNSKQEEVRGETAEKSPVGDADPAGSAAPPILDEQAIAATKPTAEKKTANRRSRPGEPQITAAAKRIADMLYGPLKASGALDGQDHSKWFLTQAGKAQAFLDHLIRNGNAADVAEAETKTADCITWAMGRPYWRQQNRFRDLGQLSTLIWGEYVNRDGGKWLVAGNDPNGHGAGRTSGAGAKYDGLVE